MRPVVLILDEPTANLDMEGVRLLVQTLVRLHRQFQVTLVVIEHRLTPFLPYADRLIWLADGRVVADGHPVETLTQMQPTSTPHLPLPVPTDEPLVALQGITAGYDGRPVLQDCSLVLHQGDFAALVGPNGAGKTTLARVLAGLLRPRRGRVVWYTNGQGRRVGLLQQNPLYQLVCDTVEEEVRFGPHNLRAGRARGRTNEKVEAQVEAVLARTGLRPLRHRPTRALSVGQQQRAALAATLSLQPALLILDEPTVGQDWGHLSRVMDFLTDLSRSGQTVLLITHDRRLVERYANQVWEMVGGKVQETGGTRHEARSQGPIANC
jgi:energy-coupling factor transport system ATP-binding protein